MLTYSSPDEHGCDEEFSRSPQEATSLAVPPGSSPELDDDDDEEVIISRQPEQHSPASDVVLLTCQRHNGTAPLSCRKSKEIV